MYTHAVMRCYVLHAITNTLVQYYNYFLLLQLDSLILRARNTFRLLANSVSTICHIQVHLNTVPAQGMIVHCKQQPLRKETALQHHCYDQELE